MLQVHQQGASLSYSAARPGREESQGWDHSTDHGKRSMARSLWICPRRAGPAAEEKQEDDQGRQADRKTDRKGGRVGDFFFLDKAALVVTTVAVMELC